MSGWRFPGWMELLTILDLTTGEYATTDKTAFPDTVGWYWTSSVYPPVYGGALDQELYVSFGEGAPGFCPIEPSAKSAVVSAGLAAIPRPASSCLMADWFATR